MKNFLVARSKEATTAAGIAIVVPQILKLFGIEIPDGLFEDIYNGFIGLLGLYAVFRAEGKKN